MNLLKNFFFNKSILFNIIKKIKLFNNILTLNFASIYSAQSNSIFKNSKLNKLNKIIINDIDQVVSSEQVNFLKNSSTLINSTNNAYINVFVNIFNKKSSLNQLKFILKNLTPEFINFLKLNNLETQLKLIQSVTSSKVSSSTISTLYYNVYFSKIFNFFKFLSYESHWKIKNFTLLNKLKLKDKKVLKSFSRNLSDFYNFKTQIAFEKIQILKVNTLKILIVSQLLNKFITNNFFKSLSLNFKFYNESNKNYNSTLISNLKLKEILNFSLNDK